MPLVNKGFSSIKNALQFVADNYSNTEEGKPEILTDQILYLKNGV
jgi:hypothetical protein